MSFILVFEVGRKMIFIVDSDVNDEDAIDVGGERIKVKLSDVLDFKEDVGGEIIAFSAVVINLPIGHMNILS